MSPSTLFAKIISYLFHPLMIPTFGLFLIFSLDESGLWLPATSAQLLIQAITLLFTFFCPLLTCILLLKLNVITSLEMKTREERKIPYLSTGVFYFAETYFLMRSDMPALIQAMMLGATLLIVATLLINIFWMISAHMVGIGGLCGMMLAIAFRLQLTIHLTLIVLILTAGLVAFSRLKLSAHSPAQVYAGFLLGFFVQLIFLLSL